MKREFKYYYFVSIVSFAFASHCNSKLGNEPCGSKFEVDHERNTFKMNGEDFRYVSGSFHYFRALPETWREKLRTMRAAGLNTVDTYVYWALHNPHDGIYNWEGLGNLKEFLKIAQEEDLYIIFRPGPYICAEIDNGGLPHWLQTKYPGISLRTDDPNYLNEIKIWYSKLMPQIRPFLIGNGGKMIMIQVENEYGIYGCNQKYKEFVRDETLKYVDDSVLLFTTDIPNSTVQCGTVDHVYATIDFGADRGAVELESLWSTMRKIQPSGPLVNSEYYPGWLTHWQEINQRREGDLIASVLRNMLKDGANVNFYMFFGGTNFGFTAGANDWGIGSYQADLTSYDYDAPMDEAGDPTEKYHKIREVIKEFLPLPNLEVPKKKTKMSLPDLILNPIGLLLSDQSKEILSNKIIVQKNPATFEQLDQFSGLVLYESELPEITIDPTQLKITGLRDRAQIFIDELFIGTLSRENAIDTISIHKGIGNKIQILVENQGRINFNKTDDVKGILGDVEIQLYNGEMKKIEYWKSTGFPFDDYTKVERLLEVQCSNEIEINRWGVLLEGPIIFSQEFKITEEIFDTYIDVQGWGKGFIFINGFNLGRYWPLVGPQISIYLPRDLLRRGSNKIVLVEFQKIPENRKIKFAKKANWTS